MELDDFKQNAYISNKKKLNRELMVCVTEESVYYYLQSRPFSFVPSPGAFFINC